MWISDLFMERVEADAPWSLFDPSVCPGLADCWGDEYRALYGRYEAEGLAARVLPAREVWAEIIRSQIETGTPYMLYKDACNAKSNQQNLGCLKTSNLCAEILEYTAEDEVAVCSLGSLCLPAFVVDGKTYDFEGLLAATRVLARNLDRVIDATFYPLEEARRSNLRHRPVGIGVQGLQVRCAWLRRGYGVFGGSPARCSRVSSRFQTGRLLPHATALRLGRGRRAEPQDLRDRLLRRRVRQRAAGPRAGRLLHVPRQPRQQIGRAHV